MLKFNFTFVLSGSFASKCYKIFFFQGRLLHWRADTSLRAILSSRQNSIVTNLTMQLSQGGSRETYFRRFYLMCVT